MKLNLQDWKTWVAGGLASVWAVDQLLTHNGAISSAVHVSPNVLAGAALVVAFLSESILGKDITKDNTTQGN